MTTTAILQIVDELGHAMWEWRGCYGGRHVERFEAHPAANFLDEQPADIAVHLRHGGERLGHICYLEHNIAGCTDLTAVAVLNCDPDEVADLYCSGEISGTKRLGSSTVDDIRLDGVAIVGRSAGVYARPVIAFDGDFRLSAQRARWSRRPKILERAAAAVPYEYRSAVRPASLQIHRPAVTDHRAHDERAPHRRPAGGPGRAIGGRGQVEWSVPYAGIIGVR